MKADISADTFRPERHFDAVVIGQGQVLLDSDFNEQHAIDRDRHRTTVTDVVGSSGAPRSGGGFAVTVAPDGRDLLLGRGHFHVDGVLCRNDPPTVGADVASTTSLTVEQAAPDGVPFASGQWVHVVVAGVETLAQVGAVAGRSLTLTSPVAALTGQTRTAVIPVRSFRHQPHRLPLDPFDPTAPLTAGAHRVELDVWDRHVSAVEDPSIREVALGDADGATRLQTVWQVRLTHAGPAGGGSCAVPAGPAKGRLIASTEPGLPTDDPCELPDEAGFRGLENQLYRVEVHEVGSPGVVLKWQRDNASTASRVTTLGAVLRLETVGTDDVLGFAAATYVEVTDDALELEHRGGDLLEVLDPPDADRTLRLAAAPTRAAAAHNPKARRWDGRLTIDPTLSATERTRVLERGLQITLEPGDFTPGDYWLIPARTADSAGGGTIVWPSDAGEWLAQEPHGIRRHTASLALVDATATAFTRSRECRLTFPPLSAITADDVSVTWPDAGVDTVQDALDALRGRASGTGACTAVAVPGPGWESVFAAIPPGADAQVCFPVGDYPTPAPVVVADRGHLVLHGAGPGATLTGAAETVLAFERCASVTVERLTVRSGGAAASHLRGALDFTGCTATVRDAVLANAVVDARQGCCLRTTGGSLTVETTTFQVGDRQIGVLAVDATTVTVSSNRFHTGARSAHGSGLGSLTPRERLDARRLLFADLRPVKATGSRVAVEVGNQSLSFATPSAAMSTWANVLEPRYPSMRRFQRAVDRILRAVLAGNPVTGTAALTDLLVHRVVDRRTTVMSQAVVVAGEEVGEVLISGNDIQDAVQGIHVAASRREPRGAGVCSVRRAAVTGNRVRVVVPPEGARGRHGIFVGNADHVRITDNDVSVHTRVDDDRLATEGLRVHGYVARTLVVRDNVVDSPGGIALFLLQRPTKQPVRRMYAVEDNFVTAVGAPIVVRGLLKDHVVFRGNQPGPKDTPLNV
ncbi:DUF6519 domain-containing protein [Kineococcus aurantiacus]|uniref:Right handed beta helix region n=1 Tax=Kineococcus aurantiacus TaxID=37633 RepID=A0A7Y9DQH8_9ACTN|nr:DUF6519 domain-containing protein [Kineococcus aurantiacus]NYD24676.1 hypothetical protein [Kineococcus aurantiacus]